MKLLFGLVLLVVAAVQLSAARSNKAVLPPKNKLYPIFDLIASKLHDYHKKELPILGTIYAEFLPKYNEYLETHNTAPYHEYKTGMENFIKSAEEFKSTPNNCNLEYKVDKDLTALVRPSNDYELTRLINVAYNSPVYKQEYKKLLIDLKEQFPIVIKNFVQSLDAVEQQKYAELYKIGQEFIAASTESEIFNAFKNFIENINFTENIESANDENCKWNVNTFETFVDNTSKYIFVDLKILNL